MQIPTKAIKWSLIGTTQAKCRIVDDFMSLNVTVKAESPAYVPDACEIQKAIVSCASDPTTVEEYADKLLLAIQGQFKNGCTIEVTGFAKSHGAISIVVQY